MAPGGSREFHAHRRARAILHRFRTQIRLGRSGFPFRRGKPEKSFL
jgi:hypothetical protein